MSCLAPCPACNRHVSTHETTCPFCATELPESFRCQPARVLPPGRLSRVALVAAGAALVGVQAGAAVTAYGTSIVSDAGTDTSTIDANQDASANDSLVAAQGAAPVQLEQTSPHREGDGPPPKPNKI